MGYTKNMEASEKPKKRLSTEQLRKFQQKHAARILAVIVAAALLAVAVIYSFAFLVSPAVIRQPRFQHYHFRTQIVIEGKGVNLAGSAFQEGYSKDNCNVDITASPVHFHDKKDQMTHVHWDGITGGQVLKYYGWNLVGGPNSVMGYRFDRLPRVTKVPIHGQALPDLPKDHSFYVYTGDETSFKQRDWSDFLHKDLEDFFDKKSNIGEPEKHEEVGLLHKIFPRAYAHAGHDHNAEPSETELKEINNLLGNVVIFVQDQKPTDDQVRERFNKLEPLTASTCGG
jgi:hypothetical protein